MSKNEELIERLRYFDRLACNDAIGVLEAQAREIDGLRKDAERYRWLRDRAQYHGGTRPVAWLTRSNGDGSKDSHLTWLDYEELDDAIDAAKGAPHG